MMGKIYRRDTLVAQSTPKKKNEKARKRNVTINFHVTQEEKTDKLSGGINLVLEERAVLYKGKHYR